MTLSFNIKLQETCELFVLEIKTDVLSFLAYDLGFQYATSLAKDIRSLVLERNFRDNPVQPSHFLT